MDPQDPPEPGIRDLYLRWTLARAKLEADAMEQNWTLHRLRLAEKYVTNYYRNKALPYINARAFEEYCNPHHLGTD